MNANCTKEKLDAFSKKHYTYINQIFGDATVRQIIEEEYPTTYKFEVEETGVDFEFSFHHTVKDKEDGHILCSVDEGYQDIYKNKNDTLCQTYSLMNYFDIDIPDDKKERQMEMIKMYRDILNGTLDNFDAIDFKDILNREILSVKANKQLWRNFVTNRGFISMNKKTFFDNISKTLDEWEDYGYWFFIGKGNCPKHANYTSEMESQYEVSRELSRERDEGYYMGKDDVKIKSASRRSKSSPKSATRRSKSSPKSATRRSKSSPKSAIRRSKSSPKSITRKSSSSPKSATRKSSSLSKSATRKSSSSPKFSNWRTVSSKKTEDWRTVSSQKM
jgi:hypothetical protein